MPRGLPGPRGDRLRARGPQVVSLNIDENQQTAAKYEVLSIPTMILFKDGEVANRLVGARPKAGSSPSSSRRSLSCAQSLGSASNFEAVEYLGGAMPRERSTVQTSGGVASGSRALMLGCGAHEPGPLLTDAASDPERLHRRGGRPSPCDWLTWATRALRGSGFVMQKRGRGYDAFYEGIGGARDGVGDLRMGARARRRAGPTRGNPPGCWSTSRSSGAAGGRGRRRPYRRRRASPT